MADRKKSKKPTNNNIEHLKTDIASFASSLGLSTSLPPSDSSGFNDVDFRNPKKPQQRPKPSKPQNSKPQNRNTQNFKPNERPNLSKPPFPSVPDVTSNSEKAKTFENLPKLPLISATNIGVWYEEAEELEGKVVGKMKKAEARSDKEWSGEVAKKRKLGERLMAQYTADYEASKGKSGDIKLLLTTQRSGTASDKISAFSVLVGDDPIANLRSLDALLGMVASKVGKRYAFAGFDALRELFLTSLLPDRKLKSLLQRPLNDLPETKDGYSLLLLWYWEECLKQRYERFVIALEEASRDMLPELKNKALKTIYVLLKSKSEQERRLLSALVNKLGDPKNKGASDADFHLSNLLRDHPNMKAVVIDEVDSFLFRPHLNIQAKYHAVNFLSQIQLRNKGDGPKVAKSLVDVYFALFKVLISEAGGGEKTEKNEKVGGKKPAGSRKDGKGNSSSDSHFELDSRLLSALLMGVNRAFPYVSKNEADDVVEAQTPTLFHLVHSTNFNVGVQALMLLHHISSKNQIVSDRFYRALYSKLLLPAAMNTSKAETFIGLLLRAMKSDVNVKRTAAFAKRLLQVALQQPPQYACGCLFLLSEVLKARPPLWNMVLQNESVDDDLEHFEDVIEETDNEPSPVLEKQEVELVHNSDEKSDTVNSDHDSSEDDIDSSASYSEDEASDEADEFHFRNDSKDSKTVPDSSVQQPQVVSSEKTSLPGGYDPRHREPSYCNADRVSWWELTVLASHVHPSVSTMAKTLLSGANIVYNGNPLNDLSLTAFLDKFMEKKPKASTWHGGSQIEPVKKLDMTNRFIGPEILSLAEEDVPAEDLVFHKFYMNKMNTSKKPKKKKKKATTEDEDAAELFDVDGGGDDESDNEEIDNMLDSAGIAMDADGDYDYDDLDQVANDDDEDLVGNVSDVSDADLDLPSDIAEGEDFDTTAVSDESDDGDDAIDIGDVDDDEVEDEDVHIESVQGKSKRKRGKAAASPFASLEEYEHLFNEDAPAEKESKSKKKSKPRKKRKSSD
ncbi:putative CCAAT-binding factor [Rosa chinensis]|uniref:Putative CCAAT-binding factor n=1 Tax=Rosa chinensis TaxID=74649 RepID=A0A2P6RZ10_ROSCH|nr:CCAAT/enhancer-binding protein zeta [Rosa chinensis]PRQ51668.1 putative CCAAT-binding factor [Rosa chinensis]